MRNCIGHFPARSARTEYLPMSIAENRRAFFDYHLEERHEAGMVLHGWEIKAIRAGQVQLTEEIGRAHV